MRIETYDAGVLVHVDEHPDPPPAPLDPAGVLATLLTVKGVITEDEAQAASGRTIAELRNEAKAWKAAAGR
ncbi:MAG: hypothetical protein KDB36_12995 [Acidimicrobiales bacterium]|nr:hypothetical protein [Acidimicrobiales bacterium]